MSIEEVEWGGEKTGAGALCNVYGRGAFFLRSLGVRGSVMSMSAASRRLDVKSRLGIALIQSVGHGGWRQGFAR